MFLGDLKHIWYGNNSLIVRRQSPYIKGSSMNPLAYRVLLGFLCSLTISSVIGQQFAVHLANVPQMALDLYVFCCGKRAQIEQGQACIGYPWATCPSVINLIITSACRPVLDRPTPWLERSPLVETLWYQLELISCPAGYTWCIKSIAPEEQPSYIPDHAVIVYMPAAYVDKVAMPGQGRDYINTGTVIKSQALVHLPTIYLKNLSAQQAQQLCEDLHTAQLCFELNMVHEHANPAHKQVGPVVITTNHGYPDTRSRRS
jgi:hypothetical protein